MFFVPKDLFRTAIVLIKPSNQSSKPKPDYINKIRSTLLAVRTSQESTSSNRRAAAEHRRRRWWQQLQAQARGAVWRCSRRLAPGTSNFHMTRLSSPASRTRRCRMLLILRVPVRSSIYDSVSPLNVVLAQIKPSAKTGLLTLITTPACRSEFSSAATHAEFLFANRQSVPPDRKAGTPRALPAIWPTPSRSISTP